MTTVTVDGRRLALSSLDRVLWPRSGTTKLDLLRYLMAVADVLLPHLRARPMTLRRFPEGVTAYGWYQVRCRAPEWVSRLTVPGRGDAVEICLIEDRAALAWVANQSAIELHPYVWRADRVQRPDQLVFDLDPGPPAGILECCAVALRLRELIEAVGLRGWPKTSGAAGLHVVVPIERRYAFEQTKALARAFADLLRSELPALVITRQARAERPGKVLVDWLQNDPWRSTVAPYSPRALPVPTVATPLAWEEVDAAVAAGRARNLLFGFDDVRARVEQRGDLHAPVLQLRQRIPRRLLARVDRAAPTDVP